MAKRLSQPAKKWLLGGMIFLIVAAGAGGAYWWFALRPAGVQGAKQLTTYHDAVDLGKQDGIVADGDMKAAYIAYVKANKPNEAAALFTRAIDKEQDAAKKSQLLMQEVSLALQYRQVDEAEKAALKVAELQPSEASYAAVARVYVVKHDYTKQREFLVKARDSVTRDTAEATAAQKALYDQQIAQIDERSREK